MYNNDAYTAPAFVYTADSIHKMQETQKLKSRSNYVGIMILISTFVFITLSYAAAYFYGITYGTEFFHPSVFSTEAYDSILLNVLTGFCNIAAIGICGAVFIRNLRTDDPNNLPFERISVKKLIALCIIGFSVCNLSNYMTGLFMDTAYSFGIDLNIDTLTFDSNSAAEIIVYILSVAVVPAFSEELLFRGAILSALRKHGDGIAVFVSSLFFGVFHGNFIQFPCAFIVGLVLSTSVVYTNSLLPAILIHFINNSFSVICDVVYTNTESWNLNEEIVNLSIYAFVIITAIIALISLIKFSRKDKNFLRLKPYEGILDKKDVKRTILTSPALIIAFMLLLTESVFNHISV